MIRTCHIEKGRGGMPRGLVLAMLAGLMIVGCGKDADKSGGAGKSADGKTAAPAPLPPATKALTAPATQAATRPAPKVFQLTPLASAQVKPSDAPQTLTWQDKVKVTIQLWDFVSSYGVQTLSSLNSFLIKQHGKDYSLPWQTMVNILPYDRRK